MFAVPIGVGGALLARPIVNVLFGPNYSASVPALQLLAWSAVLVTMRGNFRHTLNAVGLQRLDLACAAAAAAFNIVLNLLLIPRFGINGAASATVISEIGWFALARHIFSRHVIVLPLIPVVWRPVTAGAGMAAILIFGGPVQWVARAFVSLGVYGLILIATGEPEAAELLRIRGKALKASQARA
jgi:O-antigen/teichoic acid export membrane protein